LQSQLASDNVAGTLLQFLQGQTSQDTPTKERTQSESVPAVPGLWRDLWNENHWAQPRQEEDRVNGQLFRNEQGQYVLKVTEGQRQLGADEDDARSAASTVTAEDPKQLLGSSEGYVTHTLQSSMMERFRLE
jgi:hypothetical protein